MGYSINNHLNQYKVNNWEVASLCLTGSVLARRHLELAQKDHEKRWGHRLIALAQFTPIIGSILSLAEFILVTTFTHLSHAFQNRVSLTPPSTIPLAKLEKNAQKALQEHIIIAEKNGHDTSVFKSIPTVEPLKAPLNFSYEAADEQGMRRSMEDARFYERIDQGVIAGVFDGHGGDQVSKYANHAFATRFPKFLESANGNVKWAFETLINQIQAEIAAHPEWNSVGSTAVITFIDKDTGLVYTATLADTEATIYRNDKAIPLSPLRNWECPKEAARLGRAHNRKEFFDRDWLKKINPKGIRSQIFWGVNVSRALGDVEHKGTTDKPIVIHKPKITVTQTRPGDIIGLFCDGVKDYTSEKELIDLIAANKDKNTNLAQQIADFSLNEKESTDNVTALIIRIL